MRPRLPTSKQRISNSLFDPASLLSVVSQTMIHLISTQAGILFARRAEAQYRNQPALLSKVLIKPAASQAPKVSSLLAVLIKSNGGAAREDGDNKSTSFLGRPKFVPNYETNVVCKRISLVFHAVDRCRR